MNDYTEKELDKLNLGFAGKLALWVLGRYIKERTMQLNFKNWTVADYAKVLGNVAVAFGAGYAQGGYVGAIVTALVAFATLAQTPAGHDSIPK